MARRLLNILAALSLLIAVAGAALWARSYFAIDEVFVRHARWSVDVSSDAGKYVGSVGHYHRNYRYSWAWKAHYREDISLESRALVQLARSHLGGRFVALPQWTVPVLFGILPAARLFSRFRRRRRTAANACPQCGYDLRATPTRCPECGTPRSHKADQAH